MNTQETNHAIKNANAWVDTIKQLVAALEADEYPVTVDGDELDGQDAVRERITESALSVQIRSGWTTIGDEMEAEEFCILLSTGGPALRIIGELNQHNEPVSAGLEYQDWGTPWTHHYVERDTLLTFCEQFYFGA